MRWTRGAAIAAVAPVARKARLAALALASVLGTGDAFAGKPPGGTPTPAVGTIYFADFATFESSTMSYVMGSMDGDGGNRTVLTRITDLSPPSRRLHGGKRWFLALEAVGGSIGNSARKDLFAVREDGVLRVRLTVDPTMQYWMPRWAPDEVEEGATVSMLARRWTGTGSADTVVPGSAGLYSAHLSFDGAGDAIGLDADPAPLAPLGTVPDAFGRETPDVGSYSWSPGMSEVVVQSRAGEQLRVVAVPSGATTPLGPGQDPDWSPVGSRIAYARFVRGRTASRDTWVIETVSGDGSGRETVVSAKYGITGAEASKPKWSPDGVHIAYQYVDQNGGNWTNYIYRVAADGTGMANLTPEVTPGTSNGFSGLALSDWR